MNINDLNNSNHELKSQSTVGPMEHVITTVKTVGAEEEAMKTKLLLKMRWAVALTTAKMNDGWHG